MKQLINLVNKSFVFKTRREKVAVKKMNFVTGLTDEHVLSFWSFG